MNATETKESNGVKTDDKTERKTKVQDESNTDDSKFNIESQQEVVQSGEVNVLNSYRSATYNFTLAGLKKDYLKDPKQYRESELELVILRSGGKGLAGISTLGAPSQDELQKAQVSDNDDPRDRRLKASQQEANDKKIENNSLIEGFNRESPGRFDMFMENLEIETLMAFNQNSNLSLPTRMTFDVIEPYSVNGFIESLHVASVGAGYTNYQQASFVLKVEFVGYPDDSAFPDPEQVPESTRYFPIGLTGIDVDITERGTRYRCTAVPFDERAFGEPNVIKKPIKMSGVTVKEILENFIENINDQVKKIDNDGKAVSGSQHNTYVIKFKKWDEDGKLIDDPEGKIAKSKLVELLKDNALYAMEDPGKTQKPNAYKADDQSQPSPSQQIKSPETIKYNPDKSSVHFAEKTNIHDAITSVIRDSEYSRNILKNVKANIDQFGMIDYFMVKIEVVNKDTVDEVSKKPFQEFTYIVFPYKVHYKRLPNYGSDLIEEEKLKKLSKRTYNYIYSGQNLDILNFKLNFNTLFFEAVPVSMGNKDTPNTKTSSSPNNGADVKTTGTDAETQKKNEVPLNPVKTDPNYVSVNSSPPNAGQQLDDPYSVLAKTMHNAIINSKASMITGEMEILGDPFYLIQGGIGNFVGEGNGRGKFKDGSVNHQYEQLLIVVNFRNPIDINKFEDGGMMFFDERRVPFSGVYQVNKVISTFRDGSFKQRLEILRIPGQILDTNLRPDDPADRYKLTPSIDDRVRENVSRELAPTQRLNNQSALTQLGRGLPSPGLPGELSDFTNATIGLDSSVPMQTPGLVSRSGSLMAGSAVIGQPLPTDFLSNIRLTSSGLSNLGKTDLANAAMISVAANVLTGNLPVKKAAGVIAGGLIGKALVNAAKISNKGSGIGDGSSISIPSPSSLPTDPTALQIKFGENIDSTMVPSGSITDIASDIGSRALDAATSLGGNVNQFIGGIGDKINSLFGSKSDPNAVGARVGLDVSKLSGVSPLLQSKVVGQIGDIVKNTPPNVNLSQTVDQGIGLDFLTPEQIKNLPPTQPYSVASLPGADGDFINQVANKGGVTGLQNLYGVNSINKISGNSIGPDILNSALASVDSRIRNPLDNYPSSFNEVDVMVSKDKIGTSLNQLKSVSGQTFSPDSGNAGSLTNTLGSKANKSSPLNNLVTKFGKSNTPPYGVNDPDNPYTLG